MCTVTVISPLERPGTLRVVCNRDEQRERPVAAPPRWHALESSERRRAVWPTDTLAGGTWIGAGEHGLVLALLNLNPDVGWDGRGGAGLISRGMIIPALIGHPDAENAVRGLERLTMSRYAPFRLVAIEPTGDGRIGRVLEARWDGREVRVERHGAGPACFVSSGLGDRRVEPRRELFAEMIASRGPSAAVQNEFHAHRWADRPEISVQMSRHDARTVSVTVIEIARSSSPGPHRVEMAYTPIEEPVSRGAIVRPAGLMTA